MSYLFHLDQKNNTILHPEAVRLCPELRLLSEKEALFIILAFDYNSIYKQYPERQRLSKAIWHVFGDNNPKFLDEDKREKRIQAAIEAYKSLQYNRNEELISIYQQKIEQSQQEILMEDSSTRLKNIRDIISGFRKDIRDLETEIIEKNILEAELKGDRELSLVESWQTNMKHYNSIRFKR